MWHALRKRGLHGGLATRLQFPHSRGVSKEVLGHVTALD